MATAAPGPSSRRLIATVAWLYHTRGLRQRAIADRLDISQSRVSRLLEQAVELDIVRTTVVLPTDDQSVLERELESAYDLRGAHVYDLGVVDDEAQLVLELGQLLALQLQNAPWDAAVVGFASSCPTLQEAVRHLRPRRGTGTRVVVETLGDLGPPAQQHRAAQSTARLASLWGAEPVFLRLPGVSPDRALKDLMLVHDRHACDALAALDAIDLALLGFGSCDVMPPPSTDDRFFTPGQLDHLRRSGAVGEVNLRYLAADGTPVVTESDDLVIGASLHQLRRADRRMGVGGGPSQARVMRAALLGGWINEIVTDSATAQWLLAEAGT